MQLLKSFWLVVEGINIESKYSMIGLEVTRGINTPKFNYALVRWTKGCDYKSKLSIVHPKIILIPDINIFGHAIHCRLNM